MGFFPVFRPKKLALILGFVPHSEYRTQALQKIVDEGILSRRKQGNFSVYSAGSREFELNPDLNGQLYWVSEVFAAQFAKTFPQQEAIRFDQNGVYVLPHRLETDDWLEVRLKLGSGFNGKNCNYPEVLNELVTRQRLDDVATKTEGHRKKGTFSVVSHSGGISYLDLGRRPFLRREDAEKYAASFHEGKPKFISVQDN